MLKIIIILLCVLYLSGSVIADSSDELYWYLASSMIKPGREIVQKFNHKNKKVKVLLMSGGSGQLLSKILISGKGDLYTPASKFFLDRALQAGIVTNYRKLLEQKPVFGLAKKLEGKNITFNDLVVSHNKLVVGNTETMALGQTFLKIKEKMGTKLSTQIKKNEYVYAISVAQIVNYVLSGVVDAGLMFDSVAKANGISYVNIPERYNVPECAYLVTLKSCTDTEDVKIFEKYIFQHAEIFEKYGFELIK
jgi:molybdate transport system substrate-binding protein